MIVRTYAISPILRDVGRFVIGDRGYRVLYDDTAFEQIVAGGGGPDGARMLLRETEDGLRAAVYLPDALIRRLERHPPQLGLSEQNVGCFATLVEELDHLLLVAERVDQGRPVSLFELELHANVTKHLVLGRFLAGNRNRLGARGRLWLRRRLFDGAFTDPDARVRERYRAASRWAVRFLDGLAGIDPRIRVPMLRRFHSTNSAGKLELIDGFAA